MAQSRRCGCLHDPRNGAVVVNIRIPNHEKILVLMKKHGDPVDVSNRYGWIYQFSIEGVQELMKDWIRIETINSLSLNRKRRIRPELFED